MPEGSTALSGVRTDAQALARDLGAGLGFSAALAITAGLIKTPMQLPGHSAIFWLPLLVLAGAHRRPGMAIGTAACGGAMALCFRGVDALGFASLLAAASAIEAFGIGQTTRARGLRMILAGLLAHLGKLVVKLVSTTAMGLPLNEALLPLLPTVALYAAFGVTAALIAWAALAGYERIRGSHAAA